MYINDLIPLTFGITLAVMGISILVRGKLPEGRRNRLNSSDFRHPVVAGMVLLLMIVMSVMLVDELHSDFLNFGHDMKVARSSGVKSPIPAGTYSGWAMLIWDIGGMIASTSIAIHIVRAGLRRMSGRNRLPSATPSKPSDEDME